MEKGKWFFRIFLPVMDVVLMYASLFLALALRYNDFSFLPGFQTRAFLLNFSVINLFWLFLLYSFDFYENIAVKSRLEFFKKNLIFVSLASSFGFIYFYLNPWTAIAPKTILLLDIIIFSLFLYAWRSFLYFLCAGHFKKKVIIVGDKTSNRELSEIIPDLAQNGFDLVSIVDPLVMSREKPDMGSEEKNGRIFDIPSLRKFIEEEKIDLVVLALDRKKEEGISQKVFSDLPLNIDYLSFASFYENITKKIPLESVDEIWFLENISRPDKKIYEFSKRAFDIFFSLAGLLFFALIFPFAALAIKLDSPGSIFYVQKRAGKDGKEFSFYKLRSMRESENQHKTWRVNDESQVTRVGKALKRIHFDELPQFYNILKGDLSFVGPRPEWVKLAELYEEQIPFYRQRYLIRPGFTGWAQINYPASASVDEAKEKFKYDLYYIKNRSFLGDIAIILKTAKLLVG
ncbi:MAG: exopolysaccharide biosynthesis polyprenyl glycosylphosphotransferase [Candidatus Paceibacterota bacterium]|jgi:exopolysaccharide biosynthesis polyprenyl glycosylphosphotransferase